jgi:SHS2 domain-containing protein
MILDMKQYEKIDVSGDVGLRVHGKTLEELFVNAAAGLYSLVTDISPIKSIEKRTISLSAANLESLLVQWLNELVFLLDAYNFVGMSSSVRLDGNNLKGEVSGGFFDPDIHESRLLIKAATYHNLSLKRGDKDWEASVIFDI